MRRNILSITLFSAVMAVAAIPHRYFIGDTEVPHALWLSIPDSIRLQSATEMWDNDSVITESLRLPLEYRLDHDDKGYAIVRRSDESIAAIRAQMQEFIRHKQDDIYRVRKGDTIRNFDLIKNAGGTLVKDVIKPGKCYLLNFWATWCPQCLLELMPDEMPALAKKFIDNKDFEFMPVCIDASTQDLERFFNSERGKRWNHISPIAMLDIDRQANSLFATSGHLPLTVVIGKDGKIKYIVNGRISTPEDYTALEEAICNGLK